MIDTVNSLLAKIASRYADRRVHLFNVKVASLEGNHLVLQGRVLDQAVLNDLCHAFQELLPDLELECHAVRVLRQPDPAIHHVATNLTSVHVEPSWLAEMLSQDPFGTPVEVLEEQGRWVFVRHLDGYLGWMYRPYLTEIPVAAPTYIVSAPLTHIYSEPNLASPINSRLVGGTCVQVVSTRSAWAEIDANAWGWVPLADLRALDNLPTTSPERRKMIVNDSARLIGVPYLWGGSSAHGIDCSGLAQLLYRWVGLTLPRDADMQYEAGKKIEAPFQTGDLLFFGEKDAKRSITHVAISLGGWRIIHSSRSRNGVYVDDVQEVEHLRESFVGAAAYL